MKTFLIVLIIATMAATVCVAGVELVNAETSTIFIKFFGFVDIYAIVARLK